MNYPSFRIDVIHPIRPVNKSNFIAEMNQSTRELGSIPIYDVNELSIVCFVLFSPRITRNLIGRSDASY